jgi:hypothetical protein
VTDCFSSADVAPAVQMDQHGGTVRTGAVTVEVKPVAFAGVAIAEVGHPFDVVAPREERPEQDAGNRWRRSRSKSTACSVAWEPRKQNQCAE